MSLDHMSSHLVNGSEGTEKLPDFSFLNFWGQTVNEKCEAFGSRGSPGTTPSHPHPAGSASEPTPTASHWTAPTTAATITGSELGARAIPRARSVGREPENQMSGLNGSLTYEPRIFRTLILKLIKENKYV